jgi:hypothetical protein
MKWIIVILVVGAAIAQTVNVTTTNVGTVTLLTAEDPIPSSRLIPWGPGVPGGIPSYAVHDTLSSLNNDGVTDDSAAIQAALDSCPTGKAIVIPAGTNYWCTNKITMPSNVVLRGAGHTATRLLIKANSSGSHGVIDFVGTGFLGSEVAITSGYTKGSTLITVASGTSFDVGDYIRIWQDNDPANVTVDYGTSAGSDLQHQLVEIAGKSGNDLTLARELYYTYGAAFNPVAATYEPSDFCLDSGVEDLAVEIQSGTTSNRSYYFFKAARCWVKDCESDNAKSRHVILTTAAECSIVGSYMHDDLNDTYDSMYGVSCGSFAHDNLIEDNIFTYVSSTLLAQNGASGNVYAYNYCYHITGAPPSQTLKFGALSHGGNANMNLWEGNDMTMMGSDNFWGSNRSLTVLRNSIRRADDGLPGYPIVNARYCLRIEAESYNCNIIGNVLGASGDTGSAGEIRFYGRNYDDSPASPLRDAQTEATMIDHGNWTEATSSVLWDPRYVQTIPNSYYLDAQPSWWDASQWPAHGSDLGTKRGQLPAKTRYEALP